RRNKLNCRNENAELQQLLRATGGVRQNKYQLKVTTEHGTSTNRDLEKATERIEDLESKLQVWERARDNERKPHQGALHELKEAKERKFNARSDTFRPGATTPVASFAHLRTDGDPSDQVKRSSSPQLPPPSRDHYPRGPSDRDLDKIARNITRFEPKPGGKNDAREYLNDIEFYLRTFPNATVEDRIYLIKGTASQKVSKFIERQPRQIRGSFEALSQALIDEYKSYTVKTGLTAALAVKQGRQESPHEYYERLHEAYFGSKNETEMKEDNQSTLKWPRMEALTQRDNFLCSLTNLKGHESCPQVTSGIKLEDTHFDDVVLALWADKSAISRELYESLSQKDPNIHFVQKPFRFPSDPVPQSTWTAEGVCALKVQWNQRNLTHLFLVIPDLPHQVYIGGDVLARLDVQVDMINNVLWSLVKGQNDDITYSPENMKSGQTIPEACQVINEHHMVVPAKTKNVAITLNVKSGQHLGHSQGFFQPSPLFCKLGLSLEATPC
ncbi:uncharacterized protein LOC118337705, partial [Morone saxatilis]|uniref:uncharacterized protein LOC118337705 n=1 Tax=Morone saxatilis TaxID=34816 RepID=UPI0015E249C8